MSATAKREQRLFIIDGTALAYRAYFALIQRPLINSRGLNTSAIFGFTQSLLKIIDTEKPDYLAVAFDSSEPTFRHQLYEPYKATREKMPEDMIDQLPYIEKIVHAMNIPFLRQATFEADDIVGTVVKMAETEGVSSYIVSGDKDFMQLVSKQVFIYNNAKGKETPSIVDTKGVQAKLGVTPTKVTDYLGLVGDSSDNIPGVQGVGPKTATTLINEYGSIEEILANAEAGNFTNKKLAEKLITNKAMAQLSKGLVTIKTDLPHSWSLQAMRYTSWNRHALAKIFRELEFRSLEAKVLQTKERVDTVATKPSRSSNYQLIQDMQQLNNLCNELVKAKVVAFDTETTSLKFFAAKLVGIAFAVTPGQAAYVPLLQNPEWLEKKIRPLLEDPKIKKGGHNIKYDLLVLRHHGVNVQGVVFDTMIESYLLDATLRRHNLDLLALRYLDRPMTPISQLLGKGKNQRSMDEVPLHEVCDYACEDADMTLRLHQMFSKKLSKEKLEKIYRELELPLLNILLDMEFEGISIDIAALKKLSALFEKKLKDLTDTIYSEAGEPFNIQSPKQLAEVLFDKLAIHKQMGVRLRKTKTGYSTDINLLENLRPHPLAEAIIEFRNLAKLKTTYTDTLPHLVNRKTAKIHTSFNQTVAATGRLSSSEPNLQNIPIRSDIGRKIRQAFVAGDKNSLLLCADYSQVELRLLAHMSEDEQLIQFFLKERDIHSETAQRIFKVSTADLTSTLRNRAKAINFGILYGMGPTRLAKETGVSIDEAKAFIDAYFEAFPKVKEFIETMVEFARSTGYSQTLLGRKRLIPEIDSSNPRLRAEAERIAVNTPIQGSAADLIKIAMIHLNSNLKTAAVRAKLILQVHDELLLTLPKEERDRVEPIVRNSMEKALTLKVPLKAEIAVGRDWLAAHP